VRGPLAGKVEAASEDELPTVAGGFSSLSPGSDRAAIGQQCTPRRGLLLMLFRGPCSATVAWSFPLVELASSPVPTTGLPCHRRGVTPTVGGRIYGA